MSLTDHDAVAGVRGGGGRGAAAGIECVPAVEMSCVHAYSDDLHVLGYWVDLDRIAPACDRAQQERVNRAREIIERLNALGVEVTFEEALAEAGAADSIGRPHIARAAGAGPDLGPFFEEYLVPGAKAFVARALAERRAGRRADPRRGRRRRRRPSLLGRRRTGPGPRPGRRASARCRPGGHRDLLPAHTESRRRTASSSARSSTSPHRIVGLPRPHPQDFASFGRLRHLRARRAAGAGEAVGARRSGVGGPPSPPLRPGFTAFSSPLRTVAVLVDLKEGPS